MGYTPGEIARIIEKRRKDRHPVIKAMREIRDITNSDVIVPLPEMDDDEKPFVPNLILQGIEQNATRISSIQPNLTCPPRDSDDYSRHLATRRRDAILGWWEHSDLELADAQRARWYVGYGAAVTIIRPDTRNGVPMWEIRNPLDAYPPPPTGMPVRDIAPADCAFIHRHPWSWIRAKYRAQAALLTRGRNPEDIDPGELFDVYEWFDTEESVLVAKSNPVYNPYQPNNAGVAIGEDYVELDRVPNRIGECQVIMPGRITLDRPRGQFDASVGMYYGHAKLMALGMIATERDVFPDMFLAARTPGETPRFLTGQPRDGRTGEWNEVEGTPMAIGQPMGQWVTNMLDRVERAEGITAGVPSEFSGESNTNIRTGRRGEQVLEAVINFPMAEAQKILARARKFETRRAQAIAKAWFGEKRKELFVELVNRAVTYTPNEDFDSDVVSVVFPIAGTDANNLTVATGQMVGTGTMSRKTMMELSPFVRDAEAEDDRIQVEKLRELAFGVLGNQAAAGAVTLPDFARISELVANDKADIVHAIMQAQKEAQERQASSGEPGTPAGPVPPGSPEAQPGLAQPGAGQEQPTQPPQAPASLQQALAMAYAGGR